MSTWMPGKRFNFKTTPTPSPSSSTTKRSMPARESAMAAPMPENPAPTMATSTSGWVTSRIGGMMSPLRAGGGGRHVEGPRGVRALAADGGELTPGVAAPGEVDTRDERRPEHGRRRRARAEVHGQAAVAHDRRVRMPAQVRDVVGGHRAADVEHRALQLPARGAPARVAQDRAAHGADERGPARGAGGLGEMRARRGRRPR